jgi:hypothetical protein
MNKLWICFIAGLAFGLYSSYVKAEQVNIPDEMISKCKSEGGCLMLLESDFEKQLKKAREDGYKAAQKEAKQEEVSCMKARL